MNLLLFRSPKRDFFVLGGSVKEKYRYLGEELRFSARLRMKIHEAYDAFRQRFDYQENVCAALRHTEKLCLVHPSDLNREEVEQRYQAFLGRQRKKHRTWMTVDAGLALAGSLLTPIPGPNIFFFYPAARALSHYFAAQGVDRARQLKVVTYRGEEGIEVIEKSLSKLDEVADGIRELENRYEVDQLRVLLERI